MEEKKHTEIHHVKKKKFSIWKLLSVLFFVLLLVSIFTYGFRGTSTKGGVVSKEKAASDALDFINSQILQGEQTATLNFVSDENQMYKINILIAGQNFDLYVSKDGKLLFPQTIDLSAPLPELPNIEEEVEQNAT